MAISESRGVTNTVEEKGRSQHQWRDYIQVNGTEGWTSANGRGYTEVERTDLQH